MNPTFDYRMVVTLGKTNATTNVYFVEYFAIQGVVRELWVKHCVPNAQNHFAKGLILSTKSARCDFKKPFFLFDTILCRMHVEDLQRVSAKLVFDFYREDGDVEPHATGSQIIVFKDMNRKTCRMPDDFKRAGEAICWTNNGTLANPRIKMVE
jgi:acyl-CoA thioesterase FadM